MIVVEVVYVMVVEDGFFSIDEVFCVMDCGVIVNLDMVIV